MNVRMWEHPATQANVATLRERGVRSSGPAGGAGRGRVGHGPHGRAGGDRGGGRGAVRAAAGPLAGRRVLVTAGGTREPLDGVRFLGNRSSGRMGAALAEEASARGAEVVTLLANAPGGRLWIGSRRRDYRASSSARRSRTPAADVMLMAAAVADYRPARLQAGSASAGHLDARARGHRDVLAALAALRRPVRCSSASRPRTGRTSRAPRQAGAQGPRPDRAQRRVPHRHRLRRRRTTRSCWSRRRAEPVARASKRAIAGAILDRVQRLPPSGSRRCPAYDRGDGGRTCRAAGTRERPRAALSVIANVRRAVSGERGPVERAVVALLAEGHVLIEDVPGVGKTTLARALARSLDCSFARVQFTPDLLPCDVTGVSVFDQRRASSSSGPARCSRTSCSPTRSTAPRRAPSRRCSSAWRSARSRSTASRTRCRRPFFVIATQNPIEHEGTFPLPEAQLDRFPLRLALGYPEPAPRRACSPTRRPRAARRSRRSRRSATPAVVAAVHACRTRARRAVAARLRRRALRRTRDDPRLALGASPRAGVALVRLARAHALVQRTRPRAAGRRQGARAATRSRTGCCRPRARRPTSRRSSTSCSRGCPSRCERRSRPVR